MNTYTDDEFIEIVKSSFSKLEVIKRCGWGQNSGGYRNFYRRTKKLNLEYSHFRGTGNNCGTNHKGGSEKRTITNILTKVENKVESMVLRKFYSIYCKEHDINYECVMCKINDWHGKELKLPIDHIDGDGLNNVPENLRWLCPNCHSQTPTHSVSKWHLKHPTINRFCKNCNKKIHQGSITGLCFSCYEKERSKPDYKPVLPDGHSTIKRICVDCGDEFNAYKRNNINKCWECRKKVRNRPSLEQLRNDTNNMSMRAVGRKYGVTDNAVRKWIKKYEKYAVVT